MTYQIPDYSNTISSLADQLHIGQRIEVYYGSIKTWEPGAYLGGFSFLPDNPNEAQKRLRKDARVRLIEPPAITSAELEQLTEQTRFEVVSIIGLSQYFIATHLNSTSDLRWALRLITLAKAIRPDNVWSDWTTKDKANFETLLEFAKGEYEHNADGLRSFCQPVFEQYGVELKTTWLTLPTQRQLETADKAFLANFLREETDISEADIKTSSLAQLRLMAVGTLAEIKDAIKQD